MEAEGLAEAGEAGFAWATHFLDYRDDAGGVLDFHAFRDTVITNLTRGGVHPKDAQTLARHSTITLTMGRLRFKVRRDAVGSVTTFRSVFEL